jgi:hypothetical protein
MIGESQLSSRKFNMYTIYDIYESIRTIRGAEAFPCRTAIDNNSAEVYNSTEILHKVFVRIRSAKKPYKSLYNRYVITKES